MGAQQHHQKQKLTLMLSNKAVLSKTVMIFPDSGAGICLGGPQHIVKMGLKQRDLLLAEKGSLLLVVPFSPVKVGYQ